MGCTIAEFRAERANPMSARLVHVARDGKVIGQFPPTQVATLLERGDFTEEDFCYSDAFGEWLPINEYLQRAAIPKFQRAKEETDAPKPPRRPPRAQPGGGAALGAFVAFLFTFAALVGAVFWIANLYDRIEVAKGDVEKARQAQAAAEREYQKLLFLSAETAPEGSVRGSIVLRNSAGRRIAIPGLSLSLYPRDLIEGHLDGVFERIGSMNVGEAELPVALTDGLGAPASVTTTDASGRFEFKLPGDGEYVIVTVVGAESPELPGRVWFVGFNSTDPANTNIELTDGNRVQQFVRNLVVIEGR